MFKNKRLGKEGTFLLLGNGSAICGSKSDVWDETSAIIQQLLDLILVAFQKMEMI